MNQCHDCGVNEGAIHEFGCDNERCPFCSGQAIGCDCAYEKLGVDCSPGTDVYENGLSDEQRATWVKILEREGRLPYIQWPWVCARCGVLWPDLFMVPDEVWKKYVQPDMQSHILCQRCFETIRALIDSGGTVEPTDNAGLHATIVAGEDGFGLWIDRFSQVSTGTPQTAVSLNMREVGINETNIPPLLPLSQEQAQGLFDALWEQGFRGKQ